MSRQNQTEVRNRRGGIRQTGRNLSGSSLLSPIVQQGQQALDNLDTDVTGIQKPTVEGTRINKRGGIVTGQSGDATEGSSPEPDNADQIRIVGRPAVGARQQEVRGRQSPRGNFGGEYPDNASLVSPMYADSTRAAERSEILDADTLTPMKLRAIKDKYKKIASDKAKEETSNDSPSEDSQVMGMPKDQADAIEAGGSVETVIDGDSMTSTITRPEDTTPPASRRQQPNFTSASEATKATTQYDEENSSSSPVTPEQAGEDASRAYTLPVDVTDEKVDKAQSLFEKFYKKLRGEENK